MRSIASLISIVLISGFSNIFEVSAQKMDFELNVKNPGNPAEKHSLKLSSLGLLEAESEIPLRVKLFIEKIDGGELLKFEITALEDAYFNLSGKYSLSNYTYENAQLLLPGFWYRKNLRSPQDAPSARVSTDWLVREDRLSTPLTSAYDPISGKGTFLMRTDLIENLALTTHDRGEVILSGGSDLGALGFGKSQGNTFLSFSFPYSEAPFSYIRKLTLAPSVTSFHFLEKGAVKEISYRLENFESLDFSDFVSRVWHKSFDLMKPQALKNQKFTDHEIKSLLTQYFKSSYMDLGELKGFSGAHLETETCESVPILEVGFIGRVLLNAFNALQYGEQYNDKELVSMGNSVFSSYEENGFNAHGFIREYIDYRKNEEPDSYSIRRQSEGIYALLLFLNYEKSKGRQHVNLEKKVLNLLEQLKALQNEDGSFPRKFKSDFSLIDETGGSSPSAVPPLVMAYHYFGKGEFLESAREVALYQEKFIIAPSDYFSSTLDADCEDKEASLYAATAMYYLAQVTEGKERDHYRDLAKKAAYFTLSWYYTWDVPFAKGQMLGDLGLKSRGWGNVSVENNHIDVFIFEFDEILDWLGQETGQPEFLTFAQVIRSSMREQLLPHENNMMGIGKVGYYPEVVQHTAWDYGKNGKGFYNDIFAPGWTVASIWELLEIGRTTGFFEN
ncbi:hypothetical protein A33Q_4559 [Indibacter alkaliphilus LW1]|uniref:Uncharacterized protein n=1 Tax=Indibacter alkaliphilus (strain CCUG 57479 / KCTC 22604 / LW1) TaxID=1189612 RepID=S2DHF3_INDAL|nr:hypothetical protein [Indibacter alkaliphilus]EOZ91491.1 hypothetical protein A33Q_4559 [Indibacter alkaliphilus LW1]